MKKVTLGEKQQKVKCNGGMGKSGKILMNNYNLKITQIKIMKVPGAGLEPATFGCLRHLEGASALYEPFGYPMSPTRYQLRHPGCNRPESIYYFEQYG